MVVIKQKMTNEPPYQILLNKKSKIAKKNSIFKKVQLDKNKTKFEPWIIPYKEF